MTTLHDIQAGILKELLFHNGSSFSDLNTDRSPSDQFAFHLKQLQKNKLVEKKDDEYFLTQRGKQLAGTLDTESKKIEEQGRIGVICTATKEENGKQLFLLQKRLKEPFFGFYGFMTGKVRFGETAKEAAEREFKEESGLSGNSKVLGVYHRLRGKSRTEILLDHFFIIFKMEVITGTLISTKEGENFWMSEEDVQKLETFPGFFETLEKVRTGSEFTFVERFFKVDEI